MSTGTHKTFSILSMDSDQRKIIETNMLHGYIFLVRDYLRTHSLSLLFTVKYKNVSGGVFSCSLNLDQITSLLIQRLDGQTSQCNSTSIHHYNSMIQEQWYTGTCLGCVS